MQTSTLLIIIELYVIFPHLNVSMTKNVNFKEHQTPIYIQEDLGRNNVSDQILKFYLQLHQGRLQF